MARIRDVWAPNLDIEMRNIRDAIERYPYIAMDTEFPGVVARPIGTWKTSTEYHYQTLRCNVDLLKIIQVGITLADEDGHNPSDCSTWQFNFKFNVGEDMYAPESIDLLQKAGIDFQRHEEFGILPNDFAELMITSGLVLNPDTKWISFHSGYDFGYFVKLLTAQSLPTSEDEFFELIGIWFPVLYDIKVLMRDTKNLKGGLQEVADDLGVMRIGSSHQAGSDSLLTSSTFFKVREIYFGDHIDREEYSGKLFGLGPAFQASNGYSEPSRGGTTIAERDDRQSSATHNQAGGPNNGNGPPTPGVNLMGAIPTNLQPPGMGGYGPMQVGGGGPYGMRTSLVGGR
ncbi:hypothetical protein D9611_007412 [Ephemerocybe angulata]|uniref:poly(A)-specific ribonuclease n=2 Tax=Ephemerocybe angulata TaxID=980116 RepID=A0A8H5CGK2_9AGAR|nr:hypothetical protein D9611_007412 [Tulosesus angulatus]KAF6744476.1 ribonuclease H-like domain-containing protein [Tulosesus angulatus]